MPHLLCLKKCRSELSFPNLIPKSSRWGESRADVRSREQLVSQHGECFFNFVLRARSADGVPVRLRPLLTRSQDPGALELLVTLNEHALPWATNMRRNVKILKFFGHKLFPWARRGRAVKRARALLLFKKTRRARNLSRFGDDALFSRLVR